MRLEISRRSDLALRALRAVAADGGRVAGPAVAERIGTSTAFLSQVLPPLVKAGWISSKPGPDGGYELAVDPASVSVLDVIEAVEGPLDTSRCVLRGGPCGVAPCALHHAWSEAREALTAAFRGVPAVEPAPSPRRSAKRTRS